MAEPYPRGDDWLFWDPETIDRYPHGDDGPMAPAADGAAAGAVPPLRHEGEGTDPITEV